MYSSLDLKEYDFMPTLEMQAWGEFDDHFDVNDVINESEQTNGQEGGWYSSIPVDMDKLINYIQPVINYRQIVGGNTTYIT